MSTSSTCGSALVALNTLVFVRRRSRSRSSRPFDPSSAPESPSAQLASPLSNDPALVPTLGDAPGSLHSQRPSSLDTRLFLLALLVFLLTRLIGLDSFPVYFFTDEAIQTVQAANLV